MRARAVVIATGAQYRRLDVENLAAFEGSSVHYWASPLEGRLCAGQEVALVGAGNSAGQAAVYLSSQAAKVWMIVRGSGLDASMSRYLVERIAARPNIEVLPHATVDALEGQEGVLQAIRCRSHRSGFVRPGDNPYHALATSLPGVFAIGDVRAGTVKRVAAAVGEGAQVVAAIHAFLAEAGDRAALSADTGSR